jgi:hypothetical protein
MAKVEVTLAHPHDGKKPGDTIKVEPDEAQRLIDAGYGTFATKADQKEALKPS